MSSATKAELGGLFENCQKETSMGTDLEEMVHPQLPTLAATENTGANGIANETAKQKDTDQ